MSAQQEQLPGFETPENDEGLRTLPWDERFQILYERKGFYPTTTAELNQAFAVLATEDHPAGVASHLNEVFWHHKNLIEEGKSTPGKERTSILSIVRSYEAYAHDALNLRNSAGNVAFVSADASSDMLFGDAIGLYGDEPAVLEITRLQVLEETAKSNDRRPLVSNITKSQDGALPKVITRSDLYREDTLRQFAEGISVEQAAAWLDKIAVMNQKRFDFWLSALEQSRRHAVAKPLASEVIARLQPAR